MISIVTEHILCNGETSQCLKAGSQFEFMSYMKNGEKITLGEGTVMDISETEVILSLFEEERELTVPADSITGWED